MTDKQAAQLIELLARYAETYGKDCDPDMTVKMLADDIADANTDREFTNRVEVARDIVYDGLNQ